MKHICSRIKKLCDHEWKSCVTEDERQACSQNSQIRLVSGSPPPFPTQPDVDHGPRPLAGWRIPGGFRMENAPEHLIFGIGEWRLFNSTLRYIMKPNSWKLSSYEYLMGLKRRGNVEEESSFERTLPPSRNPSISSLTHFLSTAGFRST